MSQCCRPALGIYLVGLLLAWPYSTSVVVFLLQCSEELCGTWFLTLFASRANLRVLTVSAQLACAGEMLAIMTVLELPPRESCKPHMRCRPHLMLSSGVETGQQRSADLPGPLVRCCRSTEGNVETHKNLHDDLQVCKSFVWTGT